MPMNCIKNYFATSLMMPVSYDVWYGSTSKLWHYVVVFFIWYAGAYVFVKLLRRKADIYGNILPIVSVVVLYLMLWSVRNSFWFN